MKKILANVLFCLFSFLPLAGQGFWKELKPFNGEQLKASAAEAGGLYTMDAEHRIAYYSPTTDTWTEIPSTGIPEEQLFVGLDKSLYSYGDGVSVLDNGVWTSIFKKEGEKVLSFSVSLSGQTRCWITTKGVYSQKGDNIDPKLLLEAINTTAAVAFNTYGGEDALVLVSEKYTTEEYNPETQEYLELTKHRSKTYKYKGAGDFLLNTTSENVMHQKYAYPDPSITFSDNGRALYLGTYYLDEPYASDFWDTPRLISINFSLDEPVETVISTKDSRPIACLINSRSNMYVLTTHSFVPNSPEFSWIRPGFYFAPSFSSLPDAWHILSDYQLGQGDIDPVTPNGWFACDGADYLYCRKIVVDPSTGDQSAFIVRSNVAAPASVLTPSLSGESDLPLWGIEGGLLQVLDKTNLQSLSLYDFSGCLLMKGGESGQLHVGNLPRDAYLLLVVRNGQATSQKIMLP